MATASRLGTNAVAIPTAPAGARSFSQRTELDGHEYVITLDWNTRSLAWFFSLADTDDTPLLTGKKITVGTDLLSRVLGPARPPGQIVCVEASGRPVDPGLTSLGDTHELLYVTTTPGYQGPWDPNTTYRPGDLAGLGRVAYRSLAGDYVAAEVRSGAGANYAGGVTASHTLDLRINGVPVSVVFDGTEATLAAFRSLINAAVTPGGARAEDNAGRLAIITNGAGPAQRIEVLSMSSADVLAALALTAGVYVGSGSTPPTPNTGNRPDTSPTRWARVPSIGNLFD